MTPKRLLTLAVVLLATAAAHAQTLDELLTDPLPGKPNLMREEALRRGSMVEPLGAGIEADSTVYQVAMALATPPDDSHKWYISLLTQENCPPCARLKTDLEQHPHLEGWVNVSSPEHSWAHYNVYRAEDETQGWRFKNIRVGGYPTLLIQPPRNRSYGDPRTIVWQKTGYDGDAAKLNKQMGDAIKRYVAKYQERSQQARSEAAAGSLDPRALEKIKAFGAQQTTASPQQVSTAPPAGIWNAVQAAAKLQEHVQKYGAQQPPNLSDPREGPPPFDQPRRPDPTTPPADIPPAVNPDAVRPDSNPENPDTGPAATLDELVQAIPEADFEFLRKAAAAKQSVEQAKAEYEAMQAASNWWSWVIGSVLGVLFFSACFLGALFLGLFLLVRWGVNSFKKQAPRSGGAAGPSPSPTPAPRPNPSPTMHVQTAPANPHANPPAPAVGSA